MISHLVVRFKTLTCLVFVRVFLFQCFTATCWMNKLLYTVNKPFSFFHCSSFSSLVPSPFSDSESSDSTSKIRFIVNSTSYLQEKWNTWNINSSKMSLICNLQSDRTINYYWNSHAPISDAIVEWYKTANWVAWSWLLIRNQYDHLRFIQNSTSAHHQSQTTNYVTPCTLKPCQYDRLTSAQKR